MSCLKLSDCKQQASTKSSHLVTEVRLVHPQKNTSATVQQAKPEETPSKKNKRLQQEQTNQLLGVTQGNLVASQQKNKKWQ